MTEENYEYRFSYTTTNLSVYGNNLTLILKSCQGTVQFLNSCSDLDMGTPLIFCYTVPLA